MDFLHGTQKSEFSDFPITVLFVFIVCFVFNVYYVIFVNI